MLSGNPNRLPLPVTHHLFLIKEHLMFPSFHSKGTIPSCNDILNTCASGVLMCSTISFSILGDLVTYFLS